MTPTPNPPALLPVIQALRQREVQMIGAAISTRNWHGVEDAYNQLRDKIDRQLIMELRLEGVRDELAARVMPLIGPLLDAFDGMSNDARASLRNEHFGFYQAMRAVLEVVEDNQ